MDSSKDKDFDFDVGDDPTDPDVIAFWTDVAARIRMALVPDELEGWADSIDDRIATFRRTHAALAVATEEFERASAAQWEVFTAALSQSINLVMQLKKLPKPAQKKLKKANAGMEVTEMLEIDDKSERARRFTDFAALLATCDVPDEIRALAEEAAVSTHLEVARDAECAAAAQRFATAEHDYKWATYEFPRLKWKLSSHFGRHYKLDSPAIKALFARRVGTAN